MTYKVTTKNVAEALNLGKRLDDRGLFDFRNLDARFNISINAEGSVAVKLGKTEVLAGIKMVTAEPYPDHEKEGTMSIGMDLLPLSSPNFEYGQPSIEAVEIARVIDRGIRESRFINFEKLCIKEGEKVWSISVDLATLNDDGNLIDAGALAAVLALLSARMPVYNEKEGRVHSGEFTDNPIPLNKENMPLTMTFFKLGDKLFVDPTREEEDTTEGRLTIEVSKAGKEEMINAMQKGGETTFTIEEVEVMLEEAKKIFKKLNSFVEEELKRAEKDNKKDKKSK